MRFTLLTFLCFSAAVQAAQAGDDAEARFAAMCKALDGAKALRVTFQAEVAGEKGEKTLVKGSMILAEGNRARIQMAISHGGKEVDSLVVSDGTTTRTRSAGKTRDKPTDANLRDNMLVMFQRGGFAVPVFTLGKEKEPDMAKLLTALDHKAGPLQKGLLHSTHSLRVGGKVLFSASLVLDEKTHVPLGRTLRVEKGADPVTVRESYVVDLSPMLPPDAFNIDEPR